MTDSSTPATKPVTPTNPRGLRDIPFELPQVTPEAKARARRLLDALRRAYPEAHCELNYASPHELLIATILSAQCTDVAVNKATPALFKAFPKPEDYANATPEQIEPYIKSLGFFRNKAKAIHSAMTSIVNEHQGQVPTTMPELLALRGVARKTANVVLGNAFNINVGFVVDTHVMRLSKRLCLIDTHEQGKPDRIEKKLMALFPRSSWSQASHLFVWHGRRACKARMNACSTHRICSRFGTCCDLAR